MEPNLIFLPLFIRALKKPLCIFSLRAKKYEGNLLESSTSWRFPLLFKAPDWWIDAKSIYRRKQKSDSTITLCGGRSEGSPMSSCVLRQRQWLRQSPRWDSFNRSENFGAKTELLNRLLMIFNEIDKRVVVGCLR